MEMELVVRSTFHTKGSKLSADGNTKDIDKYEIIAVGKEGYPKVKIENDVPFDGIKEKSVISLQIGNLQKTLEEFEGKEEEEDKE